ncbi:N-formylglutamate amidohydrolase [Myxococcota bacterium]|nr:N-formylglutamate amidohydrolase [Myxococcota bacterium]
MSPGKRARFSLVVSAEHASNAIPPELEALGLGADVLESHVAWDPGVVDVATHVAHSFDAPLFLGAVSRLVVDLNRSPDAASVVPENAFGTPVPGNVGLGASGRRARIERFHLPYWTAVRRAITERLPYASDDPPVLHFSVHSFTPELNGKQRDLDLGVLFDPKHALESEIAEALRTSLVADGFDTRMNEPYDGWTDALCTANRHVYDVHAYAGVELEVSHRLLPRIQEVAVATARALRPLVTR